jgi:hypothetical protein
MSLSDLAKIGEALGGVAVLVSLVYLAIQIRQNTRTVRTTAFQHVVDSFSQISLEVGKDRSLSELWVRSVGGLASLDQIDQVRLRFVLLSLLRRAESVQFQSEQGALGAESWAGIRESIKLTLSSQGVRKLWVQNHGVFNQHFRRFIESEVLPPT